MLCFSFAVRGISRAGPASPTQGVDGEPPRFPPATADPHKNSESPPGLPTRCLDRKTPPQLIPSTSFTRCGLNGCSRSPWSPAESLCTWAFVPRPCARVAVMHVSCVAVQPLQSGLLLLAQHRSLQEPEPVPVGTGRRSARYGEERSMKASSPGWSLMQLFCVSAPTAAAIPYRPTQWPLTVGEQVAEAQGLSASFTSAFRC